jgi:integrase
MIYTGIHRSAWRCIFNRLFAAKVKTRTYYESGLKSLLAYGNLASLRLDAITTETMAGFAAKRREQGLEVSSINRELQVLRRMFSLAQEWRKVEKVLPKVQMLPGERHRERVLTLAEEAGYLKAAREWDMTANSRALLPDVATVLLDCALRPEECFRLRWSNVRNGNRVRENRQCTEENTVVAAGCSDT